MEISTVLFEKCPCSWAVYQSHVGKIIKFPWRVPKVCGSNPVVFF
jgi:hypothetical protein